MSRVSVRGGPADGCKVRPGGYFLWIDFTTSRCYAKPGRRRSLYARSDEGGYEFVGYTVEQCGGCGAFRPRSPDPCPLCGTTAAAPPG